VGDYGELGVRPVEKRLMVLVVPVVVLVVVLVRDEALEVRLRRRHPIRDLLGGLRGGLLQKGARGRGGGGGKGG